MLKPKSEFMKSFTQKKTLVFITMLLISIPYLNAHTPLLGLHLQTSIKSFLILPFNNIICMLLAAVIYNRCNYLANQTGTNFFLKNRIDVLVLLLGST
jgi:hypothetical protein